MTTRRWRRDWMQTIGNASYDCTRWSNWWLRMWLVTTPTWLAISLLFPIAEKDNWWKAPIAFLLLFLLPEIISIRHPGDNLPPLTHAIRGYVKTDFAFPAIYFVVGAVGGCWFGFPTLRFVGLGAMFAILG